MSLSEISIRRPVLAWMMMGALLIFGAAAFQRMGVGQLPDVDFPIVNIGLRYPGASSEVMELQVVDPIEEAVQKVPGIKHVTSSSTLGQASVNIEFNLDTKIETATHDVQAAISQVMSRLPKDLESPQISKVNPEAFPILFVIVTSDKMTPAELMAFTRDRIKPELGKQRGVGDVSLMGYTDPVRRVLLSKEALDRRQLTVSDVLSAVQAEHSELPVGRIRNPEKERSVRMVGEAQSSEDLENLWIQKRGGQPNYLPVRLADVAKVEDGLEEMPLRIRSSGTRAIAVGVSKQHGHNSVKVADGVRAAVAAIQAELPPGTNAKVTVDSTRFIRESVDELLMTLLLSAVLTALVCWLFLGSWHATFNVILAIPTSVLGAFLCLWALGLTLNTFTLLGLSLAIGIIVDDAIMVLENIVRHKELGLSRVDAARVGAQQITFAAIAATVAIAAIFIPVGMMTGIIGKYLAEFAITLTVAVAISLLEALTLTPMRCAQFLETGERTSWLGRMIEGAFVRATEGYKAALAVSLRHRAVTITASVIFFAASCGLIVKMRQELVPPQDQSFLAINLIAPVGASLDFTDKKMGEVEAFLKSRPEVETYEAFIGGYPNGEANQGSLFVTLKPVPERPVDKAKGRALTQQEYIDVYRKELSGTKDAFVMLQDLSQRGFAAVGRGFPVEFSIQGPDGGKLVELSEKMKKGLSESKLMVEVNSDYRPSLPEIQIVPDRAKAVAQGVSVSDLTQTVSTLVAGIEAGKYTVDGHRWKIRLQAKEADRNVLAKVFSFTVRNNRGNLVPLSQLVKVVEKPTVQTISRKNRERAVTVFANLAPQVSQAAAVDKVKTVGASVLPAGYHLSIGGNSEAMSDSFNSLMFAIFMGVVLSYMVLAAQFNSFLDPLTVLLALPFSASGAILALYLGNQSLNMYSLIGLVLLMGIVKKNSILLVDFANELKAEGKDVRTALMTACPVRLRPILMTSIATVAGAIPAVLAWGPGAEVRIPMGLAVIGGVTLSTILTLFIVPCVYSVFGEGLFVKKAVRDRSWEPTIGVATE